MAALVPFRFEMPAKRCLAARVGKWVELLVSGVPSASTTVFADSSIQKPNCSSTLDEVLPLGVSTMTTFFVGQFR
jgi:hypothetical protein